MISSSACVDLGHTRQHDHRHVVVPLVEPHLLEHFEARALVREAKVENDRIDRRRLQPHQRRLGIARVQHVAARAREKLFENAPCRQRVLDHEDCAPRTGP